MVRRQLIHTYISYMPCDIARVHGLIGHAPVANVSKVIPRYRKFQEIRNPFLEGRYWNV